MCPHKVGAPGQVLQLPRNTTHIKLTRPKAQISVGSGEAYVRMIITSVDILIFQVSAPVYTSVTDNKFHSSVYLPLWELVRSRCGPGPRSPRELSLAELKTILVDMVESKVWNDDHFAETDIFSSQVSISALFAIIQPS
jgi:hypothetical protein